MALINGTLKKLLSPNVKLLENEDKTPYWDFIRKNNNDTILDYNDHIESIVLFPIQFSFLNHNLNRNINTNCDRYYKSSLYLSINNNSLYVLDTNNDYKKSVPMLVFEFKGWDEYNTIMDFDDLPSNMSDCFKRQLNNMIGYIKAHHTYRTLHNFDKNSDKHFSSKNYLNSILYTKCSGCDSLVVYGFPAYIGNRNKLEYSYFCSRECYNNNKKCSVEQYNYELEF